MARLEGRARQIEHERASLSQKISTDLRLKETELKIAKEEAALAAARTSLRKTEENRSKIEAALTRCGNLSLIHISEPTRPY